MLNNFYGAGAKELIFYKFLNKALLIDRFEETRDVCLYDEVREVVIQKILNLGDDDVSVGWFGLVQASDISSYLPQGII